MTAQAEWWKNFFSGLWLDVQRQARTQEQTRAEADLIEKLLQLTPQAKVLDVPCGEGRLSLELALRGYQVTGVDLTLPLLDDARRKASEQQLAVMWEHRDMRDLPWQEEFAGAFCFWGSFGYFDDNGNMDFLKAVFRVLKPGARFLIDTPVVETILPRFRGHDWSRMGEALILEERRYDHVQSRVDVDWTLVHEGKVEKKSTSIRMYTYRELCQLFAQVGFANCEGYDTSSQQPFNFGSQRLGLVATKPA
jgi:SAM-dependent methyltransferase